METKDPPIKIEKLTFVSPVGGMGGGWWTKNPIVAVRITKEANWVTLRFEELRYREEPAYYPARIAALVFEKKLPEDFRPRKSVFCKAAYFGSKKSDFVMDTGLEIRPDGTIKTAVSYEGGLIDWPFEAYHGAVMGFGQAKCEYATNEIEEGPKWQ
jgi:hypothetical protein